MPTGALTALGALFLSLADAGVAATPGDADAGTVEVVAPTLLADSPARYPPKLEAEGVEGEVELLLLVDEGGEVVEVKVEHGVHPLLDEAAVHAATRLRLSPAVHGGTAVRAWVPFTYRFTAVAPRPAAKPTTGVLKGLVRAKGTRRPLSGATVAAGVEGFSAEADAEGRFHLELPAGGHFMRVSAPGHEVGVFHEKVAAGGLLEVVYGLEPLEVSPYETIIVGDRERTEVQRLTLREQEIREVPGTLGDPFRVVMLLPGVSSILSGLSYPVVRGTQPASTGYFLDGIRVPMLFHLFLGPAVVHPDFIDAIDFYPGGAPPRYGRLLGGVVDGRLSRPREKGLHATAYADFINAGGFAEVPIESTGTDFTLAGRLSYTPWIIALGLNLAQEVSSPGTKTRAVLDFSDYQARVEQRLGSGRLRAFAFGSSDVFGTTSDEQFGSGVIQDLSFHRVDLRYRRPLGKGEGEVGATWGLDRIATTSKVGKQVNGEFAINQTLWAARTAYETPLSERWTLGVGGDFAREAAEVSISGGVGQGGVTPVQRAATTWPVAVGTFAGAFGRLEWRPDDKWSLTPGLRLDNYHLVPKVNHFVLEPRLTARRKLTETVTLKTAAGLFHQAPVTLISLPVIDIAGLRTGIQEALQFDVGAEWKGPHELEVSVDLYINPLLRTIELIPGESTVSDPLAGSPNGSVFLPDNRSARGLAYGAELLVRHPLGDKWFGWLSYSLSRSTRLVRFVRYDAEGQPDGIDRRDLPFVFDQTHVLNLVLSYKLPGHWTLGGVFHLNSGRPESGVMTSQTQREVEGSPSGEGGPGGSNTGGGRHWVMVSRDQVDRLPPFARLDARVSKVWVFDRFTLEGYFDFLNVTFSREVLGFEYLLEFKNGHLVKRATEIPILLPILGLKATY